MYKILLVEDEPRLREAYCMILTNQGWSVVVAEDGQVALEEVGRAHYDLVLLDLLLPKLNGVDFLRRARLCDSSPQTSVIIFSNLSLGDNYDEAMSLGADKFVLKSDVTPTQLVALVQAEILAKRSER